MERFLQAGEEGSGEMAEETAQIFSPGSAVPQQSPEGSRLLIKLWIHLYYIGIKSAVEREQCPHWILHWRGEGKAAACG